MVHISECNLLNVSFDPTNYTTPAVAILADTYSTISPIAVRQVYIFFKQSIVKKDKGLIFTDYDEKKCIQLDYIKDINTLVAKDFF